MSAAEAAIGPPPRHGAAPCGRRRRIAWLRRTLFVLVATVARVTSAADEMLVDEASGLHYLEMTTQGAAPGDALPVVVALHGLGDNPSSFHLLLEDLPVRARIVIPRAPMPHGTDGFSWFDFRGAAGDDDGDELADGIRDASDRVARLIGSLATRYGGPSRAVVCGFSQGGMLSFAIAAGHPGRVAAAIPISGYLPPALWPATRPTERPLPKVFALHGEADRVIPLESARWSVEALRGNGYDASLRSWAMVKHSISHDMRVTLVAALVAAVEAMSPQGTVLEGPRPAEPHERAVAPMAAGGVPTEQPDGEPAP